MKMEGEVEHLGPWGEEVEDHAHPGCDSELDCCGSCLVGEEAQDCGRPPLTVCWPLEYRRVSPQNHR